MRNRPRDTFLRKFRVEDPPSEIRQDLVRCCLRGGLQAFEPELVGRMCGVSLVQPGTTDPYDHDFKQWVYVGDCWWCRRRCREGVISFEFARLVAIFNRGMCDEVDGLWDSARHTTQELPVIVHRVGVPESVGFIVGSNEFEVLVEWEVDGVRSLPEPVRDGALLCFEFVEDFNRYRKIFSKIKGESC